MQYNYDKIDRLIDAKKKETGSSTFFSKCGLSRGQYALWKKGEHLTRFLRKEYQGEYGKTIGRIGISERGKE